MSLSWTDYSYSSTEVAVQGDFSFIFFYLFDS